SGTVTSWSLGVHPNATAAGDNKFSVKVSDLPWFCDRYRHHLDELAIVFSFELATGYQGTVDNGSFTDDQKNELRGGGDEARGQAKDCRALVDALTASGHDGSWQVKGRYDSTTLGEM